MTAIQCETCKSSQYQPCNRPEYRTDAQCTHLTLRRGYSRAMGEGKAPLPKSHQWRQSDGATPQSSEEPPSPIPLTGTQDSLIAHKPAMPADAKMRKRTYYVTPAQDRWLTNEAHRRTLSSGDKERVTEAQLVREALDRLMKGTQA